MARAIVAELGVAFTADTAKFKAGMKEAANEAKAFQAELKKQAREAKELQATMASAFKGIAIGATIAGAAILKAFSYADQIDDTAKALDSTVEAIMGMGKALKLAGGDADNLGTLINKLAINQDKAREGADDIRDAFTRLGISGKEVENLKPDELFNRVAKALADVEDPTARLALATEILGRSAKGIDWKEYYQNYSQGKTVTKEVAEAVEAGAKAWDNLKSAGTSALNAILVLARPLADIINKFAEISAKTEDPDKSFREAKARIDKTEEYLKASQKRRGEMIREEMARMKTEPAVAPAVAGMPPKIEAGGYAKPSEKGFREAGETERVKQQTEQLRQQSEINIKRIEQQRELVKLTNDEKELVEAVNKINENRDKLIADAEREIAIENKKKDVNKSRIDELRKQIEVVEELRSKEITATVDTINARQEEQRSFSVGWEKAFREWSANAENYGKLGKDMFMSITGTMNKAIDEFVDKGTFAFDKFAENLIKNLIKIELQMQASQLMKSAMGGLGGLFKGMLGGGPDVSTMAGYSLFADGGQPPVGVPSIVGENGPELFIPKTQGTIIPNQQMNNYMNNQPSVVYNGPYIAQMSAIDTQSATQFLARNKLAVWSANQSASRGLPASRT